jgi:DNA-binding transcriptional ArsR family regulator
MLDDIVLRIAEIGPAALAVYVVLAQHADGNRECWPRVERIAALLEFSDRTVKRALRTLREAGLLTRKRTSNGVDSGVYNVYTLSQGDTGVPLDDSQGDTGVQPMGHWCPANGTNPALFPGVDNISELNPRTRPKNKRENTAGAGDPLILERQLIVAWNAARGVKQTKGAALTDARREAFRTRLKTEGWLQDALEAIAKFPVKCQLDAAGNILPDAWLPTIDWFLKPDSVPKVLEGKYDWSKASGNGKAPMRVGPSHRHPEDAKTDRWGAKPK